MWIVCLLSLCVVFDSSFIPNHNRCYDRWRAGFAYCGQFHSSKCTFFLIILDVRFIGCLPGVCGSATMDVSCGCCDKCACGCAFAA